MAMTIAESKQLRIMNARVVELEKENSELRARLDEPEAALEATPEPEAEPEPKESTSE